MAHSRSAESRTITWPSDKCTGGSISLRYTPSSLGQSEACFQMEGSARSGTGVALSWGLQEEDGWGRVRGHSGGMNIEGFRVVNPRLLQSSLERIDNSGPEIRLPHDHERRIWWVVQLGRGEITLQPSWASHWDFRNCLKTREPGASDSKTWKSLDQI